MAVNLSPIWGAGAQLLDNSGNVLSGGKIYTYAAGTTTQVTTFTSNTGITANSNPIVLNSAGRVPYEIWLTDGQNYKFVLKDSNDVLIGTWDNLSGINSNFIAYTNQQEIQTATAGQTVFNLTTMNYFPATNSLSVFVDGVNQYGPGASYAYEETDSSTVTFTSGLHDGAEVKFTSSQIQNAGVADASQITYDPPFTGAVATNVELKLSETVSVKDFGAVGDGVTDDSAALELAFNQSNVVVDGSNKTYKVTRPLNAFYVNNLKIQNLKIDSSSITSTASTPILMFAGIRGTNITVSSNIAKGASTISMTSTSGLSAGQYIFVGSNAYYSAGQTSKIGEIVKIYSVDSGTQVTLANPTLYSYNTSDSAYVQPLTTAKNIVLDNVSMTGTATTTVLGFAVRAEVCENFTAQNCTFNQYNYAAIRADRSVNTYIQNCRAYNALGAGLAYGFAMTFGCYNFVVDGCYGENLRHLVTTGGNDGVNVFVKCVNSTVMEAWDSGLDAHCNTDHIDYSHNQIQISSRVVKEGIIVQGGNFTCIGNTIVNSDVGVYYQSLTDNQAVRIVISNNTIQNNATTGSYGIWVDTTVGYSTQINNLVIANNVLYGAATINHVIIYGRGANIFNVSVTGNTCEFASSSHSFSLRAQNGNKVERVAITGNVFKADDPASVVYLFGDSTSTVGDVVASGNVLAGGARSFYLNYVDTANLSGNTMVDYVTSAYRVDSTSSNLSYDDAGTWTPVVTASTTNPSNITYTAQIGNWVRQGNTVTAFCTLRFSSSDGGTGYPIITGLPFSTTTGYIYGVSTGLLSALTDQNAAAYLTGTSVKFDTTTYISPVTNDYVSFNVTYEASL